MRRYFPIAPVILTGMILLVDYEAGSEIILTALLCLPVALAAWFTGRRWGLGLGISASLAHMAIDLHEPRPAPFGAAAVNNGLALATFSMLAILIDLVARQRAELKSLVNEKNLVLTEVHHRVKNNLQVISSLLSLEAGKINNKEAALVFKECRDRIHLMARLHERLCAREKFASVDLSAHLRETAGTLVDAHSPTGCHVRVDVQAHPMIVDIDTAMTLGLIANEAILNSLKHAFRGRSKGSLTIRLTEGSHREMVISDDGNGLPEGFMPKRRGSLGLELIHGLSRQIRGEAKIENRECGGASTIIRFPSPAAAAGEPGARDWEPVRP